MNITSTTMSAMIDDLQPYTEYHIRAVAYNDNGQGMPGDEKTVTTFSASKPVWNLVSDCGKVNSEELI